jgi:hypothetical protein
MAKKQLQILNFKYGVINSIEPQSIPRGAASASLNWITKGSKIELRRGYALLGTTENTGTGRITGLGVGKKPNGNDIIYRTRKRKVEYLDTVTGDWAEIGTNILAASVIATSALGEDISIEPYQNATGPQIWLNSQHAGPLKIMTANPGSYTDMYVLGTNYKGYMRIKNGRMYVWKRFGNPGNDTDLFCSHLDVRADSDYTQIVAEVIAGAAGTLAFKAAGARRICFQVVFTVTAGGEVFTDNGDGTLTGSLGTTGATINYTSGAYTGVGAGTCTYRWADDSAAAASPPTTSSAGIANFLYTVAGRVATEGFILPQAGGGSFQNLMSLNGVEYCIHEKKTWAVTISADDADVTNLIFRSKVGIPNWRAAVESSDGIYYIDDTNEEDVHFRILTLDTQSTEVLPKSVSRQFKVNDIKVGIDLSNYRFDQSAAVEFGDMVLFACRTSTSTTNDRVFIYNKISKGVDIVDYYVSCFAVYDGTLVAGDSVTDNVYTLFDGLDDNGSTLANSWESSLDDLGYNGMKRVVELTVDGEIGPEQSGKIMMSVERGPYVEVRSPSDVVANVHAIEGSGDYVDSSQSIDVGAYTLGRGEIGGGSAGISAYHYRRTFRIALDKFEYIMFKIEATGLGYLSVTEFTFADVRLKWGKIPQRYRIGR